MKRDELSPEALALVDSVLEAKEWVNPRTLEEFDAKEARKQARLARNRIKDNARWPGNRKSRKRTFGASKEHGDDIQASGDRAVEDTSIPQKQDGGKT